MAFGVGAVRWPAVRCVFGEDRSRSLCEAIWPTGLETSISLVLNILCGIRSFFTAYGFGFGIFILFTFQIQHTQPSLCWDRTQLVRLVRDDMIWWKCSCWCLLICRAYLGVVVLGSGQFVSLFLCAFGDDRSLSESAAYWQAGLKNYISFVNKAWYGECGLSLSCVVLDSASIFFHILYIQQA